MSTVNCTTWEEPTLGNIFVRKMYFQKSGEVMQGHKHNFDHTTIVFKGSVGVQYTIDNIVKQKVFSAPRSGKGKPTERGEGYFVVPKDVEHKITALEDDTEAWCVFAHRDQHGEVVQNFEGNEEAYG